MAEATSNSTSILKLVNKTLDLPTIPAVLLRLNDVISAVDSSAEDVANVIALDPGIATNMLRIVNSAYYGLQVRVSSVGLAVSIMGFETTKKVALKAAVFSVFAKSHSGCEHFDPKQFWNHSIFCGVAARALGKLSPHFTTTNPEDLYVCGLLHDIGKIILREKVGSQYEQVLALAAESRRPEMVVEAETFGFTHADVGSVLGVKWFLPEDLTIAIRYHHTPHNDPFHKSLSSLIHLADHLAWTNGRPSTQGTCLPELRHEVYEQIGLTPSEVERAVLGIRDEFDATETPWS